MYELCAPKFDMYNWVGNTGFTRYVVSPEERCERNKWRNKIKKRRINRKMKNSSNKRNRG